jgi:hypothetical protein
MLEELWQSSARIPRGTHKKVMYLLLAAIVERPGLDRGFLANHPCEHDSLKPLIVEYLLEKTAR